VDDKDLTGAEAASQPTDDAAGTAAAPTPGPAADAPAGAPPVEPDAASTYTGPRIAIPTGMGQGPVYPTADQLPPPAAPAPVAGLPTPGRAGALLFWIGVAVAVGASVLGYVAVTSLSGGFLWWGGYFVTFALWSRAFRSAKTVEKQTGRSLSTNAKLAAAVGIVVAVGSAAWFGITWAQQSKEQSQLSETVGSCWARDGEKAFLVACSDSRAEFRATTQVTTGTEDTNCPSTTVGTVATNNAAVTLCLEAK
jgi:hypothetical protein